MNLKQRLQEDRTKLDIPETDTGASTTGNVISIIKETDTVGQSEAVHPAALPEDIEPSAAEVTDERAKAGEGNKALEAALAALDPQLDQYGSLRFMMLTRRGRLDALLAESQAALDKVAALVQARTGRTPSPELLKRELAPIRAAARERDAQIHVHNRIARVEDGYLYDLGDPAGRVVHITARGCAVEANAKIAFQRGFGYGQAPEPVLGSSPANSWRTVLDWLKARGVPEGTQALVAALLVEWLRPDTPAPILEVIGPAGGGKTTLAEQLAALIDPSDCGFACVKATEQDIAAAACNRYVLGCDNASSYTADEQDLICRLSTGTTLTARRYYTQAELFQVFVRAPLIITSILPALTRADARSRTITARVSALREYISAQDISFQFQEKQGELLGALFSLLSAGLAGLAIAKAARAYTHRLADYEQLGEAITAAIGWQPGEFGALLARERRLTAEESNESDSIIATVSALLDAQAQVAKPSAERPTLNSWAPKTQAGYYAIYTPDGALRVGVTLSHLLHKVKSHPAELAARIPIATERALSSGLTLRHQTLRDLGIDFHTQKSRFGQILEFRRQPSS
jgi:uncharacterized protein YndB with AHSA1/START domain